MNESLKAYVKLKKECEVIGKKYGIKQYQNVSDNVYLTIECTKATQEEKSLIWDLYHDFLYFEYKEI